MHSAIFELTDEPIKANDYMTADDISENFKGIADYWTTDINRGWLNSLDAVTERYALVNNDHIIFSRERIKQRFESQKLEVQNLLNKANSVEDYVVIRYQIQSKVNDRYGFYIYYEGFLYTFDNFLANLVHFHNEEEIKFYLGGVVDYHA